MLRPTQALLAALVSTTIVVTGALGWAGWRLLDQQRAIDEQRARDQVESSADLVAADIRGKLAEAGERLSGWLSNPSSPAPAIDGAVVVAVRPNGIDVNPPSGLPFVPVDTESIRSSDMFAAFEAIEFGSDRSSRAIDGYRSLATHHETYIRAGALLRLGRVLRRARDFPGALLAYQQLAELGAVRTEHLPAELAGLDGQRASYIAMAKAEQANEVAARLLAGLDSGRWSIARGTAEFYRDSFTQSRPASWNLATALDDLWRETDGRLPSRGQRVLRTDQTSPGVVVLWRSNGTHSAALAASADHFFDVMSATPVVWQLIDPEGHVIRGDGPAPARSVTRIIGNAEYPWTLYTWMTSSAASAPSSRMIVLGMVAATLVFVWGASYFMMRAIRREAAVTRLQSDFVAAVSHEFRSPLTTVRQMAEMLEADRVPTDERRHKYYKILAGEATRLQRLVETLLNFGKMEAGAERYRFGEVDAAALVREVVDEIAPHARESGKDIEIDGPHVGIRVLADQSALAVALRNLIDNAIKYSPDQPTVWVHWRQDDHRAAISVVDRGVGIPRAEQQTIFRKFVRGRAAIDANIKGTGLGLCMVQQIVTAHGGEIRLDSEPGRGSTFTLLLPAVS